MFAINFVLALVTGLLIALVYVAAMYISDRPLKQLNNQVLLNHGFSGFAGGFVAIRDVLLDSAKVFMRGHAAKRTNIGVVRQKAAF